MNKVHRSDFTRGRLLQLADHIEGVEHYKMTKGDCIYVDPTPTGDMFNMFRFFSEGECGTTRCIGGWSEAIFGEGKVFSEEKMAEQLGMEIGEVQKIAYCASSIRECATEKYPPAITPTQAAGMLRFVAGGDPVKQAWIHAIDGVASKPEVRPGAEVVAELMEQVARVQAAEVVV